MDSMVRSMSFPFDYKHVDTKSIPLGVQCPARIAYLQSHDCFIPAGNHFHLQQRSDLVFRRLFEHDGGWGVRQARVQGREKEREGGDGGGGEEKKKKKKKKKRKRNLGGVDRTVL